MPKKIKVAELFAGVGGFRLGLEGFPEWGVPEGNFEVVWANQWEPPGTPARQFAYRCYVERFDPDGKDLDAHSNENIEDVLERLEQEQAEGKKSSVPKFDMLVGGFPCQDYSVARTLAQADGLEGKKGVLWWSIYRLLKLRRPKYLLLENVDRMLKSPASQRGRDFAIMLSCLNELGYSVEWRVINAADYGFPQRRRRVFIFGVQTKRKWNARNRLQGNGIFAEAFPVEPIGDNLNEVDISAPPDVLTNYFGVGDKISKFQAAGVMQNGVATTIKTEPKYSGPKKVLGDFLIDENKVPESFFIDTKKIQDWEYQKGSKRKERISKTGHKYFYAEGSMAFPDSLNKPARTILTGEGGASVSRFKHIIQTPSGRFRRLTPDELDQLQMFPKGWTDTGMTDGNRAFCIGNALVVGVVQRIGQSITGNAKP